MKKKQTAKEAQNRLMGLTPLDREWTFVDDIGTYTNHKEDTFIIEKIKLVETLGKFEIERVPVYKNGVLSEEDKVRAARRLRPALLEYGEEHFTVWRKCEQCRTLFPKVTERRVFCTNACKQKHSKAEIQKRETKI